MPSGILPPGFEVWPPIAEIVRIKCETLRKFYGSERKAAKRMGISQRVFTYWRAAGRAPQGKSCSLIDHHYTLAVAGAAKNRAMHRRRADENNPTRALERQAEEFFAERNKFVIATNHPAVVKAVPDPNQILCQTKPAKAPRAATTQTKPA
jgi:hypothetical protein